MYYSCKPIRKRPGPKSKTVIDYLSPLKLTIKQSTCHGHGSEVVSKKKGRVKVMDEMIQEEGPHTPSPTPSEILRPEVNAEPHRSTWESLAISFGFLAPEALDSPAEQELSAPIVNGDSSPGEPNEERSQDLVSDDPEPPRSPTPPAKSHTIQPDSEPCVANGTSEMDSESDTHKTVEQESSDSSYEKDGSEKDFAGFDKTSDSALDTPPVNPNPVGSLTILAPSALNSSIVNGSLPPEPLDSNAVSDTFSCLSSETVPSPVPPAREGLTVLSPAALGVTSTPDPMGLLRGYVEPPPPTYLMDQCEVCGERSDNMEQHRAAMGHYKCHVSTDCAIVLFTSALELRNHQHVTHGILPTPSPPPQASIQQLTQQVQRLPVPYGMPQGIGTPPPAVSPGYRSGPGTPYTTPPPAPSPLQGSIQARPFALQTSPSTIPPDGSPTLPVVPPGLSRSISISPSVRPAQKRASPSPVLDTQFSKRSRPDSPDCELVDVQQKLPMLPSSISLTVRGNTPDPAGGVANILASRGITVTPAVNKNSAPVASQNNRASVSPVTTLNLSSAVSIVPASQARSQFAVPQGRGRIERQARPLTVDLTQDTPPVFPRRKRFTCQVCDKVFTSQETLNQHLTTHRSPAKLPYKCNLCNAQYPTQQAMLQHKQAYHKEAQGSEMALPVVDIKHPGTVQKLSSLGIRHCLILSQLGNASGGVFGLPIVAIDNARNPAICNLGALGASNVLSLGPAKALR